ncbi:Endoribonuclease L-PSP/chorismate mutase-like protein [Neohortaea acidophila]|uniref:Endoribonuclease L-PSP/chorismate mutase-like protein n=1 Tax=Neohortaea acidophila TaxID=245834 RepID=A0A6A6Q4G6_9PEZI|nr:Endoribonuclease L-PSP/chorismate mutase-like protein [Neohortaea acidophila]KAF2487182.1 Endoribonuclease L-PSP/chorismate mutase-like protein [Neohortaea acidophila]
MALSFHVYPGLGETNSNVFNYSQSVRMGSTIRTAGQGGFTDKGELVEPMREQLVQACKNVEKALKDAGGQGWSQVVSVRSYHIDLDASFECMVEMFKEFMPNHRPVWVAVGVAKLGEGMHVEIEAEAFDDHSAWSGVNGANGVKN